MKKAFLFFAVLLVTIPLLGCQPADTSKELKKPIAEPSFVKESADPLTEARTKLFQELGLNESGEPSQIPKNPEPLPVVSPNPPELPAVDGNSVETK
ncbi:MAG: hypothetical protein V1908_02015 [Candidatus Peregrinibacteria bacterium]